MQLGPKQHHVILRRGCISESQGSLAESIPVTARWGQALLSLAPMDHVCLVHAVLQHP